MSVRITDKDNGAKALLERVSDLAKRNPVISVGIMDGGRGGREASQAHSAKAGSPTIRDIAEWNEFGTDLIPERSFIRAWFDEAESGLRVDLAKLTQSVVTGKRTADEVLEILGLRSVGQIQARISQGIPPENAPSTKKQKAASVDAETTPLIDTGVLRSSITYKVEDKG